MNIESLKKYYEENKDTILGHGIKRKEHTEFRIFLRKAFPFIEKMRGRKELSIYLHCLINNISEPPLCEWCSTPVGSVRSPSFPRTCSYKCNGSLVIDEARLKNMEEFGVEYKCQLEKTKEKARKTCKEKWGSDHYMKSESGKNVHRDAVRKKHGVDNVFQLEDVKNKIKQTHLENIGVDNPMKCKSVRDKVEETNIRLFGFTNPMKNKEISTKARNTSFERYGNMYPNSEEGQSAIRADNIIKWGVEHNRQRHLPSVSVNLLEDPDYLQAMYTVYGGVRLGSLLGVSSDVIYYRMKKFGIKSTPNESFAEKELADYVQSILGDIDVIRSDRHILDGKEIDIVIPSLGIGIEYNGLYYHSVAKGKDRNYHLNKTKLASQKGIRLLHVFEDEWLHRKEQVKSKISAILGNVGERVFARKCTIERVNDTQTIKKFYEKTHIQGSCNQRITVALKYDSNIVAMISFKCRQGGEFELTRYSTSCNVIGGFSKLLKYSKPLLKQDGCNVIVSFADKRYSVGDVYLKNGWTHVKDTPPDYQYVLGNKRERKQKYRRKYLPRLDHFDESLTEFENVMMNGIYPIYDCGLMKFRMEI